jgi:fructose-specific component phosphotransferase system IIB-like protein
VKRWVKISAALALAVAVPATAQTFGFSLGAAEPACLTIGNATYRVTNSARPDVTVRIDPAAAAADIRIAIAATPDEADFVFVDDGSAPACSRGAFKSVRIDAAAAAPDLVIGLAAPETPNYRIYVRSRWLDNESAAALFAAAHMPARRLSLALIGSR